MEAAEGKIQPVCLSGPVKLSGEQHPEGEIQRFMCVHVKQCLCAVSLVSGGLPVPRKWKLELPDIICSRA